MAQARFMGRIRVWRQRIGGKEYLRYVIVVPTPVGKLLDPNKEYIVVIMDPGEEPK